MPAWLALNSPVGDSGNGAAVAAFLRSGWVICARPRHWFTKLSCFGC